MPRLMLLRSLGHGAFDYLGDFNGYVTPQQKHSERTARARHLFYKAIANKDAAARAASAQRTCMVNQHWAQADVWFRRLVMRERLFTRRMIQHRTLTENLSSELMKRGL